MGYNTVVVLMNDHQHRIAEDGPIGRRIADAMSAWWSMSRGRRPDLNFNAGSVISCDHADGEQVVIVHGNCGQQAQDADHLGGQALDAMKGCLERHGYKVTKPRKPKPIAATPAAVETEVSRGRSPPRFRQGEGGRRAGRLALGDEGCFNGMVTGSKGGAPSRLRASSRALRR